MDNKIEPKLNEIEEQELREGQDLYEMTKTPGFLALKKRLEDVAFHSWVDPREIEGPDAEREWKWRELNAFHAANNARELLEWIQSLISRSEYLEKKKSGEIKVERMTI
jgi:hypothetical protein